MAAEGLGPEIWVVIGLGLAFYMAFNLGANDAANPTDTAVGSGALTIRQAVLLFAFFAFVGAVLQGYNVIKTIGKGVVKDIDPVMAVSASLGAGLWVSLATRKGLPVSTTHSTVGAVLGVGLARMWLEGVRESIDWAVVTKIVASWITSPLGAILLAAVFYYAFAWADRVSERFVRAFLIGSLAFSAYAFGTNDVGNATGVYVAVVGDVFGMPDVNTMRLLALLGGVGITLGALLWGYRVIMTVGFKITRLNYRSAIAAELSNALVVYLFTLMHMPVSTTHASVSSVIGVGIAKNRSIRGVDLGVVAVIIAGWILTLPVAGGLAAFFYWFFRLL